MDFLALKDISERYLELINPTSPEKVVQAGRVAGMRPGARVIDFGCGYAEPLVLWAQVLGIAGTGIDIRPAACERARGKIAAQGLADRIQIVCGDAAQYTFEPKAYDVATCIGATFCWKGGFADALEAMRRVVKAGGRLIVGEAHWLSSHVPPEQAQRETSVRSEGALLRSAREADLELVYALHSSRDEWDRYESENWRGLSDWLDENPAHPERDGVLRHLRDSQDEYVGFAREHFGWALYVLKPRGQ